MTPALRIAAGVVLTFAGLGGAASILHSRERAHPPAPSVERLLYLRSGNVASRVFLSFDTLAADVYWIRTIQHYGRDRKSSRTTGRFELLAPLLDLTTTLDPYLNIAYRFGAIFLSSGTPNGPGRPDQAIALLEKGLQHNPTRWQYAHDIGFVHYWYTGNYQEAARWFEKAASLPNAPAWIRPMIPIMLAQGGDRAGARRMLGELLNADQAYIRQAAERGLLQLRALEAIDVLQALVERYKAGTGNFPETWGDLIRVGLLPGLPADDTQSPFIYDAATRLVTLSPRSPLNPLPKTLTRK